MRLPLKKLPHRKLLSKFSLFNNSVIKRGCIARCIPFFYSLRLPVAHRITNSVHACTSRQGIWLHRGSTIGSQGREREVCENWLDNCCI